MGVIVGLLAILAAYEVLVWASRQRREYSNVHSSEFDRL